MKKIVFISAALLVTLCIVSITSYSETKIPKDLNRKIELKNPIDKLLRFNETQNSSVQFKVSDIYDTRLISFSDHQAYVFMQGIASNGTSATANFGLDFYKATSLFTYLKYTKEGCPNAVITFYNGYEYNNVIMYQNFSIHEEVEGGATACSIN